MRSFLFVLLSFILLFSSCVALKPKDFTYLYTSEYTGLDTLIDINGCYIVQRGCDSSFYSVFMFYDDGLFTIATTSNPSDLLDCFENGGKSNLCQYPSWGTYRIEDNIIKTQTVLIEGMGVCTIFRNYLIDENKNLTNVNDYVNTDNTNLGYMKNYPSFTDNICAQVATFYPLSKKRDVEDCPFILQKWFSANK